MSQLKKISRWLQAGFYIAAGLNHFVNPDFYLPMMPDFLPVPDLLHKLAGGLEILGGVGLLLPRFEAIAAWILVIVLLGVFPANLLVAIKGGVPMGISATVAWLRLPFQILFLAWAYWHTKPEKKI